MPARTTFVSALVAVGLVLASPSTLTAQVDGDICTITGSDGDDLLVGTDGDDVVCGLGGDDVLVGGVGDDVLLGGDGDDKLIGSAGNDVLIGGAGDDLAFGGPGRDSLRGEGGADELVGGPGRDVLRGGLADDVLAGGDGADVLWGGPGDDLLRGSLGADVLYGGPGDDVVRGGSGVDRLRGGPSSDVCIDLAPATNGINCEFGVGGNDDPLAVAKALWELRGATEFVYAVSGPAPCGQGFCQDPTFVDVVRVDADGASSEFGSVARTASELFGEASNALQAGYGVEFDSVLGLPVVIEGPSEFEVAVTNIALRDDLRAEYERAAALWSEFAPEVYEFTVVTECQCPEAVPRRVSVDGAVVTSAALDGLEGEWTSGALSIDGHLSNVADLLDGHVIELQVEFDEVSGVPVSVRVDRDPSLDGDEFTIRISDFVTSPTNDGAAPDDHLPSTDRLDGEHPADDVPRVLEIVSVAGIEVSSVIADDLQALIDAARADGFSLSGGGFRDPQRQIDLRRANCGTTDFAVFEMPADQCSPPTARPGQSQHEVGLAIDFTNDGRLITTRSDPAFVWLVANAEAFGLINLPSEPWHWSTTGN